MRYSDSITEAKAVYHSNTFILRNQDLKHVLYRIDYLSEVQVDFDSPEVITITKGENVITVYTMSRFDEDDTWCEVVKVTVTGPDVKVAETKLNRSLYDYSTIPEGICEVYRLDGKVGLKFNRIDLQETLSDYGLFIEGDDYVENGEPQGDEEVIENPAAKVILPSFLCSGKRDVGKPKFHMEEEEEA